jgi:hypothetical protein
MTPIFLSLLAVCNVVGKSVRLSIPLADIDALTLRAGRVTAARRMPAAPQLECFGSLCVPGLMPDSVQCYNRGYDGNTVQWQCDAELDKSVKFGRLDVSCEGFSMAGDPNVLVGSCGLRYELVSTRNHFNARLDVAQGEDSFARQMGAALLMIFNLAMFCLVLCCIGRCIGLCSSSTVIYPYPPVAQQAPYYSQPQPAYYGTTTYGMMPPPAVIYNNGASAPAAAQRGSSGETRKTSGYAESSSR